MSTLPILDRTSALPCRFQEGEVCFAPTTASCEPGTSQSPTSSDEAPRDVVGPAWVADSAPTATEPPLPVALCETEQTERTCAPGGKVQPLQLVASRPSRNAERDPSPLPERDCTRGPRSLMDVLDCLM
jgi:hypothetical protein